MAGKEVLASVCVLYPEETDTEKIVSELKSEWDISRTRPIFHLNSFGHLGTGMPTEKLEASACSYFGTMIQSKAKR